VPFFKDLPVLGILFSSKDFEEKATEIIFILTPSISSGGKPYEEILEEVQDLHRTPKYDTGIEEAITDPFGSNIYRIQAKERAAQAEFERRKAEIEKAAALEDVEQIKRKLLESAEEVMIEKAKAAKALSEAERAKAEAHKAQQEAEKQTEEMKKQQQTKPQKQEYKETEPANEP
jgi:hypothetical protein